MTSKGLAASDDLLQQRQEVGERADLLGRDQNGGVLEHRLLGLNVGDEVREM
jgi:hypothetical protein